MVEKIITRSGVVLLVEKGVTNDSVEVSLRMEGEEECLLHWGLSRHSGAPWQMPPQSVWPEGSRPFDKAALQTPFLAQNHESRITIRVDRSMDFPWIGFALFFLQDNRWDNNNGANYKIQMPRPDRLSVSAIETLMKKGREGKILYEHTHDLENEARIAVSVSKDERGYHVRLITDLPGPLILHWGLARRSRDEWTLPPKSLWPVGTTPVQNKAAQSPFVDKGRYRELSLAFPEQEAPMGISFVLKDVRTGRWSKEHNRDFFIPIMVPSRLEASLGEPVSALLADEIIEREMSPHSWTLMHRFNLCYDLLDQVGNNLHGLAVIFVWLRFSAIRQLDWQRNYNTKPRELSHAMDRLTVKLADRYAREPADRELIRLILATMGRGGEGQRVRDEVLNIMHRHHIKEVSGHFMEEWHQKLHNNTTPDDVVICEAYLQFLRSDGRLPVFYKTLEAGGVTKARLEGYERPITSAPDFIPHLKDALIQDFEHFLGILKEVHSGTDLGAAIHAARQSLDIPMHNLVDFIWQYREGHETPVAALVAKITEARRWLTTRISECRNNIRDLLFLDLALEDFLRVVVERNLHVTLKKGTLVALVAMAVENLLLTKNDEELRPCLRHWETLSAIPGLREKWSLEAKAVLDRLGRALGNMIDQYFQLLQPKAEFLGKAFRADPWTITLFTEEVVRGRPAFVLSALVRQIDPILRNMAHLGNWQVISPGRGTGSVHVVGRLLSIQGKSFSEPTVIVADQISGEEEIPEGVTAIITADTTDIVSHVAIRARNAHCLLATCYDQEIMARLKSLRGLWVTVRTNAAGDVDVAEGRGETKRASSPSLTVPRPILPADFSAYAIRAEDFTERNVGGKSYNLKSLQDKLPTWIHVPTSVALPFGVFERVLSQESNKEVAERYRALSRKVDEEGEDMRPTVLDELRRTVLALKEPDELASVLRQVMEPAGLPWPENWHTAWRCIKAVWGSKWNERAYLSRRTRKISHENLFMAVLVQEVVEADYSFVIHTVNPVTGDREEIFAEVVPGLGETLVGNYPGKALSVSCPKGKEAPRVLAFPSKSVGLFGGGLIFRSDSNGEDLAGYAGAGLYESVMLRPPREVRLDYTEDLLSKDKGFQNEFLVMVARIGEVVEQILGSAQDIEGAYSRGQYWVLQTRPQVGMEDE
jgi:alpha-glucan,water dikinase